MRTILLSIAVAVQLVTAVPAWADPGDDRGDKDRKEYFKRLEEQQRETRKRFEEQQREDRKRNEEQLREDDKRAREATRDDREVLLAQVYRGGNDGYRQNRGGYDAYRHSGYRGYTPLAPYPARLAPQPGAYDSYPVQPTYPYRNGQGAVLPDQSYGGIGDRTGYGQDSYGGYPSPGPGVPYGASPDVLQAPYAPPTGGEITALADQLVVQAETYLQEFLPKIGVVPESQRFLADGTALRDSAIRFRDAAFRGAPPAALAAEFRNMQASWQRLEARMARVSKGRIGPNIARNLQMGVTIEQIGQLMPY